MLRNTKEHYGTLILKCIMAFGLFCSRFWIDFQSNSLLPSLLTSALPTYYLKRELGHCSRLKMFSPIRIFLQENPFSERFSWQFDIENWLWKSKNARFWLALFNFAQKEILTVNCFTPYTHIYPFGSLSRADTYRYYFCFLILRTWSC